jgi:hypothetical protein
MCVYAKSTITQIHYYHDYSSVGARFCYSSGENALGAPDAHGRELRNASGPEEKKTLERQIKDQDDLINRYQADLTKRGE